MHISDKAVKPVKKIKAVKKVEAVKTVQAARKVEVVKTVKAVNTVKTVTTVKAVKTLQSDGRRTRRDISPKKFPSLRVATISAARQSDIRVCFFFFVTLKPRGE